MTALFVRTDSGRTPTVKTDVKSSTRRIPVSFGLMPDVLEDLDAMAEDQGTTRSAALQIITADAVKAWRKKRQGTE